MGLRLWRNNIGQGVLVPVAVCCEACRQRGRVIKFGVPGPGGSDLIGIGPAGRFMAIEAKHGRNQPTAEQNAFLSAVDALGGIAAPVWSVEQFRQLITK